MAEQITVGTLVRMKPTADGGGSDREFRVIGVDDDCVLDDRGTWVHISDVEPV